MLQNTGTIKLRQAISPADRGSVATHSIKETVGCVPVLPAAFDASGCAEVHRSNPLGADHCCLGHNPLGRNQFPYANTRMPFQCVKVTAVS